MYTTPTELVKTVFTLRVSSPLYHFIAVLCRYSADLDMSHYRYGWQMQNNGQLRVTCPNHDITTRWQHRMSDDDLKTTLTSNWGRGKQLQVILTELKTSNFSFSKRNIPECEGGGGGSVHD